MRNENTSSRYDSRKLRDPQRNTGKYIYRHIKLSTYFVRIVITIRYIGGISVKAWYISTSYRDKIPTTSLFTPTLLVVPLLVYKNAVPLLLLSLYTSLMFSWVYTRRKIIFSSRMSVWGRQTI